MTVKTSVNDLNRRLLKVLALLLAVITVFGTASYAMGKVKAADETTSATETTTDDAYEELQSQYEALENQMSQNQQKLDQVQNEMDAQEDVVDNIGDKIDDTQNEVNLLLTQQQILNSEINHAEKQIDVITAQLGSLSEQIAEAEATISDKQAMLDETYELLKMRIRAMYMAGNGSTFEFLLTSEDFSTLLTRTELLVRVAQQDNDLMASLESDIEVLGMLEAELSGDIAAEEQKKSDLNSKTQELEKNKSEIKKTSDKLAEKQQELEKEMKKAEAELDSLDKESDEYKAIISRQEDELIALSAQMEEFIRNNGSSTSDKPSSDADNSSDDADTEDDGEDDGEEEKPSSNPYLDGTETVFSSGMIFPLKCSGVYISSPYGMRTHPTTGEYKLHTGTDFCASGINGKTVYAVKDGTVIYAQKHKAYGNFVIIDHGNGVSSCYAHMQDGSMTVSVGSKVLQGQPIGKVGSTGYSTGPHLHFEIRIDGATTNPMNGYIKLP
ncbi:MAG: peptidoglycan DD-metalloendopeptidase family protein [Clostridia bacterium]|nr:peptidoglycan DD-metalloendopeptidase family protein [Clostridia bacterium]